MAAISFIVLFYSFHWSNIIVLVLFVLLVLTGSIGTVFRNKALLLAYGVLSFAGLLLFGAALVVLPFTVFQTSFLTTVASMVSAVFVVVFFVRLSLCTITGGLERDILIILGLYRAVQGLSACSAWYLYSDSDSSWSWGAATRVSSTYNPNDFYAKPLEAV